MIKGIIFDFGNVICSFDNNIFINQASKISGKSREEIIKLYYKNTDLYYRFESGSVSKQEFFEELSDLLGIDTSYEELKRMYSKDKLSLIPGIKELIENLKENYKLALASNTSEWDFEEMMKVAPFVKDFNSISTSFEVKAMKPKIEIFEDALKKLDLKAEECIFIDDLLENAKAAEKIGIKGIHFVGIEEFKSDLEKLGVKTS